MPERTSRANLSTLKDSLSLCASVMREYGLAVIFDSGCASHDGLTNLVKLSCCNCLVLASYPCKACEIRLMKIGRSAMDPSEHDIQNCENSFSAMMTVIASHQSRKQRAINRDFECLDCSFIAPLNAHGRCQRCDSNGVIRIHASAMMAKRAA